MKTPTALFKTLKYSQVRGKVNYFILAIPFYIAVMVHCNVMYGVAAYR